MARKPTGTLNATAAINRVEIDALPLRYFYSGAEVIPYGSDNLYPNRVNRTIRKSPTAKGAIKGQAQFIYGQGFGEFGNIIVNRNGETLNDIVWQAVKLGYCSMGSITLHVNFNALGQISELFFVSPEYVRKNENLLQAEYSIWESLNGRSVVTDSITVDLYGAYNHFETIVEEGAAEYKGACWYYTQDNELYGTSPIDEALVSASFEYEAQVYPYANIKNGFSGNTVIKIPTMQMGEEAEKELNKTQKSIDDLHGSDRAGSSLVVQTPMNANGDYKEFKMIEHLSPTNVDSMFVNQNSKAERDILKTLRYPEILLGVSSQGMFNEASYVDAYNFKINDTEFDRQRIESEFRKILSKSIWMIEDAKLIPLERLKKGQ